MDLSVLEIRKIKYNDYIEKHPNKPYGYYALGEIELMDKSYSSAITYFTKALCMDENYSRAKIGYLLCLLQEGKYIQAIKYFDKKCKILDDKKILLRDLIHGICSKSPVTNPDATLPSELRSVNLRRKLRRTIRLYKKKKNPVSTLLLALYFFDNKAKSNEAIKNRVYQECAYAPGLIESLRMHIVEYLSLKEPDILDNDQLASMFNYIPESYISETYANKIFSVTLKQTDVSKVKRIFKSMTEKQIAVTHENMWHYVYLFDKLNKYDSTVMYCCKQLLKEGWVDSVISGAMRTMKEIKIEGMTEKDEELIELYGY